MTERPKDGSDEGLDEGTDYKVLYEKERQRFVKLWDAYEAQESELRALRAGLGAAHGGPASGVPGGTIGSPQDLERFAQALVRKEEELMRREGTIKGKERELGGHHGRAPPDNALTARIAVLEERLRKKDEEISRLKARRR